MGFFSYKQLARYMECPLQFKRAEVDKAAVEENPVRPFFGNLIGTLIEQMYVGAWWREPNLLGRLTTEVEHTARSLEQLEDIRWPFGQREKVMALAHETIPKILATMRRERLVAPVVRAELDLEFPVGRHTVVSRADLIFDHGADGIEIVDVKGGGTIGRFVKTNQLRCYALGVIAMYQKRPRRAGFWWVRHDTVAWKRIGDKSLATYATQLAAAIEGLRSNQWTPTPGTHCVTCDFRRGCTAGMGHLLTDDVGPFDGRNEGTVSL